MKFDNTKKILVIGRAGLDIYPEPPGTKISDVNNFSSHLGGSAANTCVALSNLGVSTDLLTCISDDAIGEYIINKLNEFKVGVEHCRKVNKSFQTQIAVVETILKNNQSILYRSNPCDLQLNKEDINKINFNNYSAVLIIDLDYRPYNWESDTIKSDVYKEIMNEMDIIIGNDLEFNVADNSTNGLELAKVYIKKKPSVIVYKMGEEGSKVFTKENESQYGTFNVEAIKPTGAGDAFNGGFISSLYNGLSLEDAVIRGSANAAIVVTKVGCSSAMPNNQELEKFINQNQKEL